MKESSLKAKTAKGLFWGGVGNGLQQLFNLFFGIFLARLLDASDYGMIGMLAIFSAISSVIQEGGFGAALINKEKITQEDCNAVFWFSLSAGFCLYILLFLSAPFIAGFYGIPELAPLSRFMFLGFLIGCTGTVHGAIFTKRLMIKEKIHINLIALFCSGCIGLAMAYCGMAYWAIATQQVSYMLRGYRPICHSAICHCQAYASEQNKAIGLICMLLLKSSARLVSHNLSESPKLKEGQTGDKQQDTGKIRRFS